MAFSFLSFSVAKTQLEKEMDDLQQRWMHISTAQSERSTVQQDSLNEEIADRRKAIEKLDTKTCCDRCESPVETPQLLRFRITHSTSMVALDVRKVLFWAECEECCRIATPDQIRSATLTTKQKQDLDCYASRLIKQVEGTCKCRIWGTWEDLRNEAYTQTLEGRRNWFTAHVDLFGHLLGAMKGIAYGWGKESKREVPEADSVKYDAKTGEKFSPFDIARSKEALPDRRLIRRQELERFKTALVIEPENSVLRFIKQCLEKDGFKVIDISSAEEGLRQYLFFSEYIRFDLVVVSHSPNGVKLALDIFRKNASQKMIITTTHVSEADVFGPVELSHVPILSKPFLPKQLRAVLQSFYPNKRDKLSRCRRRQRRTTRARKPVLTLRKVTQTRIPQP